jgi:hypothetical protein
MHDPGLVRSAQRLRNLAGMRERLLQRQPSPTGHGNRTLDCAELPRTTGSITFMRRIPLGLLTFVLLVAAATSLPAWAQDCGDWNRPVVCRAELIATDAERDRTTVGERGRLELGPREQVELELDARDQRGSRFPLDRLALAYDDYRCGSMLRVEDQEEGRLRISATVAEGRCTLEVWLPNNLNFEWEIEIEISAASRANYERGEAEFLANALYTAVLNREPDAGGFGGAVAEIQRGNLDAQIMAMVRSAEFQQLIVGKPATEVLEQFYQGIMGRPGDSAGVRLYLSEIERRMYASVLGKLIQSAEFESRLPRRP